MTRFICHFIISIVLLSPSLALANTRGHASITVLAASGMTEALTEASRLYSRLSSISITVSFSATAEQASRIIDGESADIIISDHPYWIAQLKQMGLVDVYTVQNLVKDKLSLVSSVERKAINTRLSQLSVYDQLKLLKKQSTMVVIPDDYGSGLGLYIRQMLENIEKTHPDIGWSELRTQAIRSGNAKETTYYISQGQKIGFTFRSNAIKNHNITILSTIPSHLHDEVVYQAAVVASENMEPARKFLEFLQTPRAQVIFEKYGLNLL